MHEPEPYIDTEYFNDVPSIDASTEKYVLRLYVSIGNPNSNRAIYQVQKVCAQYLAERHELEIIDIHRHPERLEQDKIFATPTLVKAKPAPLRKLVGDMPNLSELLVYLNL